MFFPQDFSIINGCSYCPVFKPPELLLHPTNPNISRVLPEALDTEKQLKFPITSTGNQHWLPCDSQLRDSSVPLGWVEGKLRLLPLYCYL